MAFQNNQESLDRFNRLNRIAVTILTKISNRTSGSMSPGQAAGIACAVWIPIGLLLLLYFLKLR